MNKLKPGEIRVTGIEVEPPTKSDCGTGKAKPLSECRPWEELMKIWEANLK